MTADYAGGLAGPDDLAHLILLDADEPFVEPNGAHPSPADALLGSRLLSEVPDDPPDPLLLDRLDPQGHTILYGTGGSGKGTLVAEWMRRLIAEHGQRILLIDYENHPAEWSTRLSGLGGRELREQVLHVAPFTARWRGKRGAIWRQAEQLRQVADAHGATLAIVDSIVPACGATDSLKPEAAGQYAGALELIGRPTLSLAHTTKLDAGSYPFGSVFWHNLARVTWSLQRDGERSVLRNRKANNYRAGGRYVVEVSWQDGTPREVWEKPYSVVLADRIAEVLSGGPLTLESITAALNAELEDDGRPTSRNSVQHALRRNAEGDRRRFDIEDKRWRLVE